MAEYVSHDRAIEIMKECNENIIRLHSCDRHDFQPDESRPERFVCMKCLGWVGSDGKAWYDLGRSHGYAEAMEGAATKQRRAKSV
jgi:hypothetical protein